MFLMCIYFFKKYILINSLFILGFWPHYWLDPIEKHWYSRIHARRSRGTTQSEGCYANNVGHEGAVQNQWSARVTLCKIEEFFKFTLDFEINSILFSPDKCHAQIVGLLRIAGHSLDLSATQWHLHNAFGTPYYSRRVDKLSIDHQKIDHLEERKRYATENFYLSFLFSLSLCLAHTK